MTSRETIAAISTAISNSGISIVRISGPEAIEIVDKIFKPKKNDKRIRDMSSHTIHYGNIINNFDNSIVDEVLIMVMKAPNTYTKEDVIEIDCHGGVLVTKNILNLLIKNGARIAEPGEFTKRAFLNGRIDLSQAEAVIEVINSKNNFALSASINHLRGDLSDKIIEFRKKILHHIAFIEAALDDPEHISIDNYGEELKIDVVEILEELEKMNKTVDNGRIISEGIKTVILGKPNAGKSSLLNCLLKEERAIVTDIAGTTRDTLEEKMSLNELNLNIIDTAGIRETEDIVEKIGVDKALNVARDADLIIYVVDSSVELDENDKKIMELTSDKKSLVILNKSDLECIVSNEQIRSLTGNDAIKVSAKNNIGIEEIEKKITEMFYSGIIDYNDEIVITNMRHKELISESISSLNLVIKSIDDEMPEDFYSIDLMNSYETLGRIIGESVSDNLVDEIFSSFCMGK